MNNINFYPLEAQLKYAEARYTNARQSSSSADVNVVNDEIIQSDASDSFRIFHGRGGSYEGLKWLTIDYFYPVWVVTLFARPDEGVLECIVELLKRHIEVSYPEKKQLSILLQRRYLPRAPWEEVYGESPKEVFATRAGKRFTLNFNQQNAGFFLDIEPARKWLELHAQTKNILNMFSYTCSFSVVAAAAGAKAVVNIDLSRRSLDTGRSNHRINNLSCENIKFLPHDILKSWGKLKRYGLYDIVIVDPPSFQKGSFVASKDYTKLLNRLKDLVAPNGSVLLCLNAPEVSLESFLAQVINHADFSNDGVFVFDQALPTHEDFPDVHVKALKMLVFNRP